MRSLVTCFLLLVGVFAAASGARGQDLGDLEARMDALQAELDETTERIEELRTDQDHVRERIAEIELEVDQLEDRRAHLLALAEDRAAVLYKQGSVGMFEALASSEDFGELLARAELAQHVSDKGNEVFYRLARDTEELNALNVELDERSADLAATTEDLEGAAAELQDKFEEASDEYEALQRQLARERREAAAAAAEEAAAEEAAADPANPPPPPVNGKVCPVDGPNSFIDSWGAPRVGHTHVGTDVMADYGTPLVAIVSGTVSSGWSDTGGNMIFLSGDDGHSYWYLHNERNIVTSGRVSAGQLIATVGDTGNAVGIPHLHFEYHPGGGGPVNPYPLLASIC
ncbi:MAG: peptidoglycan DD-metalloendopeptidase family protein [Actinomycetota bacterium]|nr:peptidoglycan DD-metalloendopeptidase family protein [Actinomycetota bacterium]